MNTSFHSVIFTAIYAPLAIAASPVSQHQEWTEDYMVTSEAPRLSISNVWGSVRVRAGEIGKITVTVDENRTAPDQAMFDRSLETINLVVDADADGVSMIVGGPKRQWRRLDRCPGCRVDYQFEVQVPPGTRLDVSTVLDGRVDVVGVTGPISAGNVNGPIIVSELHDCQVVESVNGSVSLSFARAPSLDCAIDTINGDITVSLPSSAGLDVALDQFNGRTVSEIEVDPLALPARIEQVMQDGRYRYRIEQHAGVRLGGGGPTFSFTSLNGDIQIRKNQ
jgi:hypothetical protein